MKKLLIILLAAMLTFSLASCQGRDEKPDEKSSSQTSQSTPDKPSTAENEKAKEDLLKTVKTEYGTGVTAKFKEEKKINGKDCFVFDLVNGKLTFTMAISKDGSTLFDKEMGSGTFLAHEKVLTPASYLVGLLQDKYAVNLLKEINALGAQIKDGSFKNYPADFPDKTKFPKISDTDFLTFCYNEHNYLDDKGQALNQVYVVVPIDATHVMICNVTMEKNAVKVLNPTFKADFNADTFAKENNCTVLKAKK